MQSLIKSRLRVKDLFNSDYYSRPLTTDRRSSPYPPSGPSGPVIKIIKPLTKKSKPKKLKMPLTITTAKREVLDLYNLSLKNRLY